MGEWTLSRLSDAIEIIGGGTPNTQTSEYWGGAIPWLSVVDFNDGYRWVSETEKTITEKGLECSSTTLLRKGDIIISARGTVGAIAQLAKPMAFNQSCYGLRALPDKADTSFLYYAISQSVRDMRRLAHGAVFDTITRNTFDSLEISLPTIPEQRTIAHILGTLDDKIELNRRMNETLEAMARALFKSWFVDFEPVRAKAEGRDTGLPKEIADLFPDSFEDSELGEVPKGWRIGSFSDASEVFDSKRVPLSGREREQRKGHYPYYGAASVMDYVDDYLFDGIYLLLGEDGSVINSNGTPVTQYAWGKFWVNNHAHVIQGKNGFCTEHLLLHLDNTNITAFVTGAVQPKLNQGNLNRIPIIVPEPEILAAFNTAVSPFFAKIRNFTEQSRTLAAQRDALLPKLLSGEIRVA